MKQKFFISVSVAEKVVDSFFSENLDNLVTLKAIYGDCEIMVFDLCRFERYTPSQVAHEIQRSGHRWKKSLEKKEECVDVEEVAKPTIKKKKTRKRWNRKVLCIETGEVFSSIRECSERLGLSHKEVWNAINSGNDRNGLHFMNISPYKVEK